jgi:hypothetical protein
MTLGPSFSTKMSRRFRRHQRCFYVLKAPKRLKRRAFFVEKLGLDVKKSNSSNVTPNVMTVGVENYGPTLLIM